MKKILCVFLVCALMTGALCLTSCGEEETKSQSSSDSESGTEAPASSGEKAIKEYLAQFTEGDDPLYGTWQLKGFEYLSYIFRNDDLAEMVMGTEGDFAALNVNKNKKTLSVQLMIGLNGNYTYSFSDDNDTLTLISTSDKSSKLTLTRQDNYSIVPKAPSKAEVDSEILGWWKSSSGMLCCLGGDGIMYSNSITFETCYTYTAKNGKINAIYQYGGEMKEKLDYKLKGKKLTLNGIEYKRTEKP